MKLTDRARAYVGQTIEIKWGTSKGRDTYGYTTCSLYMNGKRLAACNGGGYDMRGTVLGRFLGLVFAPELVALKPEDMPRQSEWQSDHSRICAGKCSEEAEAAYTRDVLKLPEGKGKDRAAQLVRLHKKHELPRQAWNCCECPTCGGRMRDSHDGKRVDKGRYFYGLRFHDPNYKAGEAVIGTDCSDRTLTKEGETSEGKTVEQAEKDGVSFGLERLQAQYRASAPHATERHTVPDIDGACGESCVMDILHAIGLALEHTVSRSKLDVYVIRELDADGQRCHAERIARSN